jgi:hypothetical protein
VNPLRFLPSLLEVSVLYGDDRLKLDNGLEHFFNLIASSGIIEVVSLDYATAYLSAPEPA